MHRNVVITGASSGIGAGLAVDFAAPGITLGLVGRDAGRLESTASRCRARGAETQCGQIDVCDESALAEWLLAFDTAHPVDLVIASAGVTDSLGSRRVHETPDAAHRVFRTNVLGVLNTVYPLLDRMRKRRAGSIAVISSLSAWRGIPVIPAYSASKAAIKTYFEGIRGRLRTDGVHVSVVCPGYIDTPMTASIRGFKYPVLTLASAVRRIRDGIEKRRPLIVFPLQLRLTLWLVSMLPERLADRAVALMFPYRPESPGPGDPRAH